MSVPAADVEPVPANAAQVFGARLELARRYATLLCTEGVVRGVIGPREPARIWSRHLLNGAALAPLVPAASAVTDLGSGAGLPGIPLALVRPDLRMTLLEPLARRMSFLRDVCAALALDVELLHAAAGAAPPAGADVVVARAVAPLVRLLGLALPLLRPGGVLLAAKGATARSELDAAGDVARTLPVADMSIVPLEGDVGGTVVICVRKAGEALPLAPAARRGKGVR